MRLLIHSGGKQVAIDAPAGTNLADAILAAGFNLSLSCGGFGACGRCSVKILNGRFTSASNPIEPDRRTIPSCTAECDGGPAEIEIPPSALITRSGRILEEYRLPRIAHAPTVRMETAGNRNTIRAKIGYDWEVIEETEGHPPPMLGLAIDIGTTTVASAIIDLHTGTILSHTAMFNQQLRCGEDVASRIAFCRDDTSVRVLQRLLIDETINTLIEQHRLEVKVDSRRIVRITMAGNTTMMHLVAGSSPAGMGSVPFTPVALSFPTLKAGDLGIHAHPNAVVDLLPSASAYIGADVVSDLLVAQLEQGPLPALLVDIGTNGEIVLATENGLHACATAAGPAFEGAGLSHGCRATNGAVDHIRIGQDLEFHLDILGGGAPRGLCGSAVIDFLAAGRHRGLLNEFGRLNRPLLEPCGRLTETMNHRGKVGACILSERSAAGLDPITLSEPDIEQVLKAKAAIQAGINVLLEIRGIKPSSLKRLVIAGGFGHYLDLGNAIAVGLLPAIDHARIEVIGNGSLAGAIASLCDESILPLLDQIALRPSVVELNRIESFQDHFIESLMLDAPPSNLQGDPV